MFRICLENRSSRKRSDTKYYTADDVTIFPEKLASISSRFIQNKGEEKKENELVVFRKLTLLKNKLSHCFLLLSFLEPLIQGSLNATFLGRL